MDRRSIDRIRNAEFAGAVRGYDRGEVDAFLAELAEWLATGGADGAGAETVREELERVGERTAGILTEAHEAAEQIKGDASRETRQQLVDANVTAEGLRGSAEEYSEKTREEADAYAGRTRRDADAVVDRAKAALQAEAAETRAGAEREAEQIVADANRKRTEIEARIAELEERRDAVLAELDRLASGIAGAATRHRSSGPPGSTEPPDATGPRESTPPPPRREAGDGEADTESQPATGTRSSA